jgi:hypothetical protein
VRFPLPRLASYGLLLGLAPLVACSGTGGSSTPPVDGGPGDAASPPGSGDGSAEDGGCEVDGSPCAYPTVESFCAAIAKAECQETTPCGLLASGCAAYRQSACLEGAILMPSVTSDIASRTYTPANAAACVDAVTSAFAAAEIPYASLPFDTCERVFVGSVATNGLCTNDYDCASGLGCVPAVPSNSGGASTAPTCQHVISVALGDSCATPGDECQGSSCQLSNGSQPVCGAFVGDGYGATCATADECGQGVCVNFACYAPRAAGETCTSSDECALQSPLCDGDGICSSDLVFTGGSSDCGWLLVGAGVADAGMDDGG